MAESTVPPRPARRNVIRRWLVRAVVFLLLGVVVNVVVAWGCASNKLPTGSMYAEQFERNPNENDIALWQAHARVGAAAEPGFVSEFDSPAVRILTMYEVDLRTNRAKVGHMMWWMAAGWPCRSVSGGEFHDLRKTQIEWQGMYFREDPRFGLIILLSRPRVGGFVINSVFYAVILWLLFATPFALRRWRRVWRGLCPKCAYPVGTSNTCTECGHTLRRQSV